MHCNCVILGNCVFHPQTGKSYNLRHTSTCDSMNVIYLIKCPCGLAYIGQTSRKLKVRISEHKSNIRRNVLTSTLAKHWNASGHSIPQFRFQILEVLPSDTPDLHNRLLRREIHWIYLLDTLQPRGLNDRLEMHCFL